MKGKQEMGSNCLKDIIKAKLKQNNMTTSDLCRESGVARSTIDDIFRRGRGRYCNIDKIAEALGLSKKEHNELQGIAGNNGAKTTGNMVLDSEQLELINFLAEGYRRIGLSWEDVELSTDKEVEAIIANDLRDRSEEEDRLKEQYQNGEMSPAVLAMWVQYKKAVKIRGTYEKEYRKKALMQEIADRQKELRELGGYDEQRV